MAFTLEVPGLAEAIQLDVGESLFVLGANGTGKSALQRMMAKTGVGHAKKVSATRQTWFTGSGVEFTPSQKTSYESQIRSWDTNPQSRYAEQNPQFRPSLAIYDLIDAENVDAREIARAVREGDQARAEQLATNAAPIEQINELLSLSNIPIEISIDAGDRLMASKLGSPPYPASHLSDGERNALLIGAEVLSAKPGTLLVVDEPERHLHRSITSPLLSRLFKFRDDCAFVVATHDLTLPIDNADARVLLVRSCTFANQNEISSWEADLLPGDGDIDDELKRDIVGARRRIVFIEGDDSSLDKPIYSIIFPDVSVRAKGSARDVQQAVDGIRATDSLHWVQPFGIVDNDGRTPAEIEELREKGIFALPFYSVESLYYHPDVMHRVADRHAEVIGGDPAARVAAALTAGIDAVRPQLERLAARGVEKSIRGKVFAALPTFEDIRQKHKVTLEVDTAATVENEVQSLATAADAGDWLAIATRCPIRETGARRAIAGELGFKSRWQYEEAVVQLLRSNADALAHIRSFFGDLPAALDIEVATVSSPEATEPETVAEIGAVEGVEG